MTEFNYLRSIKALMTIIIDIILIGYAFVEFEDSRDAEDCIKEMDGYRLSGRPIVVEWAKGKRRGGEGGARG